MKMEKWSVNCTIYIDTQIVFKLYFLEKMKYFRTDNKEKFLKKV